MNPKAELRLVRVLGSPNIFLTRHGPAVHHGSRTQFRCVPRALRRPLAPRLHPDRRSPGEEATVKTE